MKSVKKMSQLFLDFSQEEFPKANSLIMIKCTPIYSHLY